MMRRSESRAQSNSPLGGVLLRALALSGVAAAAMAQAPNWTRISIGLGGADPNGECYLPHISGDGRFVAYASEASNLVLGDIDSLSDVFVHDRQTGLTSMESLDAQGGQTVLPVLVSGLSGNGQCVAFVTPADLTATGVSAHSSLYLRDRASGTTELISIGLGGAGPDAASAVDTFGLPLSIGLSHDGRFVAFSSAATNLVAGDTNLTADIFVRDRVLGTTARVNLGIGGAQASGPSIAPSLSSDGRYVAYESRASNLVAPDANNAYDVFLHDRVAGRTLRCSSSPPGAAGNLASSGAAISGDGRRVVFSSRATNLDGSTGQDEQVFAFDAVDCSVRMLSRTSGGVPYGGSAARLSANGAYAGYLCFVAGPTPGAPPATPGVYVHELASGALRWTCAGPLGTGFSGYSASLSADGRFCTLLTDASGIDGVDLNQMYDVYLFDATSGDWPDADGDAHGAAGGAFVSGAFASPGRAGNALDCDDADPTRYRGARELLDGLDNDCDNIVDEGVIEVFCTSSLTSGGCVPRVASRGAPRVGAGAGFVIDVLGVDGQRSGLVFYGVDNSSFSPLPWAAGSTSWLCVRSPIQRSPAQASGGSTGACDGAFSLDWSQFVASFAGALGTPFTLGDDVYLQAWFRDPPAARATNLSDAVRFTLR